VNILLISQCSKRALTETRRILDQFAERRGDRTWQTPITQQGLDTLRHLLKKTARRNTAVACHWIRGRDHSEVLWIVGDASQFSAQGSVPTNSTGRDILRSQDENDWHTAEDIRLLSAMAALFHDFGKASVLFQKKLEKAARVADPYRHEWVSLRLFQAFVGSDDDRGWLARLAVLSEKPDTTWQERLLRDGKDQGIDTAPLQHLPRLARAIGWLIVSHHRLPAPTPGTMINQDTLAQLFEAIDASWCGSRQPDKEADIKACWNFKLGLPDASASWRARAGKLASRMLARGSHLEQDWLATNPYVAHLARLALMLADHHYSSRPARPKLGDVTYKAYANTDRTGELKQRLDEHLIGVEMNAHRIVRSLPHLQNSLPRIARHKGFKRRSDVQRFRWQDKAFDLATSLRHRAAQQGFFGVNMASTGCGKTLANGRIMYGLADPQRGARFSIALGLRTLTLQTGKAYRTRLGLGEDDLAVLVGGSAVRQLFDHHEAASARAAMTGSESAEALLPDNTYVHYEGNVEEGPLNEWLEDNGGQRGNSVRKLLNAPVLICTIDHLMPATESTRGGHQIAPMLRLMTSDLVLDEPDDFSLEDLPALTRLVHWAGLLGSRVLLSSATLPPALIQGLFAAFLAGRRIYQQNRGMPGVAANVCCAWFDEHQVSDSDHPDETDFRRAHDAFVRKRLGKLAEATQNETRRRARILPVNILPGKPADVRPALAALLLPHIHALHAQHHSTDPVSGKRVSFGLVRMANIDPLIDVARALFRQSADAGHHIHLCVYHSRHPLLVRSAIEQRLDRLLQRGDTDAVFKDFELRKILGEFPEQEHIFVVLASPVAEVGRDHDYDWAIVEPSSMRSIIQLAGRIRRHRSGSCKSPNVLLLDRNCRAIEKPGEAAFVYPGFESNSRPPDSAFLLASHRLAELLRSEESDIIDAKSRIVERSELDTTHSLVDLEHARLGALMLNDSTVTRKNVRRWWETLSHYSAIEQRDKKFRDDGHIRHTRFVLRPDESGDECLLWQFEKDGLLTRQDRLWSPLSLMSGQGISEWGRANYIDELAILAEALGMELDACAQRFGWIDLPGHGDQHESQEWLYHPILGFRRKF
jgi:CRISPR-associated endonuclease/helicase Cas3